LNGINGGEKMGENEEDEENPYGDKVEYGGSFDEEESVKDLEFCPFCEDFVEAIDGECVECGYTIPSRAGAKIKPKLAGPQYYYRKGQELFKNGKSGEEWFRKAIALDHTSYWAYYSYYYLGRENFKRGELIEAEDNFRKALSGISDAEWLHYYLGKTLLKKSEFTEAESEFKKALEIDPTLEPGRAFIDEIKLRKTKLEFPKTVREVENLTENVMLENHALIEWFEINLREFVKTVLEEKYGYKLWWRRGVPEKARKDCAARKEESPEEEMESPELSFMQFYNYAEIVKGNKDAFNSYIDTKEWIHRLNKLEPIRNGIMHCRGRHISNDRNSTLTGWCYDLEEIMKKLNKNSET
jgi:tetratricopeptide (TPR) repeat protein